ncbi:MAG: MATE family efflux transporter [Erysipelotrichaceae bacterium]|nr:MATE family efflux transporter [Erysipelotrichaceae bacterium]
MLLRRPKKDILHGNILEQMMLLFFPFLLSYFLQQIYGFVDNIVLGRFVGKEGLAAVGGSPTAIINIIINCVNGLTSAITVMVAQYYGMGNMEKVNKCVRTGIFVAVTVGAFLSAIMITTAPLFLKLMNTPADTMNMSLTYMRLYFISLVPYFIYQTGVCILRALGDSKRPLYFVLITAVTKIGFDLLLAGAFKMGVLGTSISTLLAHLVCAIVILVIFRYTSDVYQFSLKDFGYEKEDLKKIFSIGIPFALQSMMFAIPSTFIQKKLNDFGTDAVAAYSAYVNIDNLFWCFSSAVSTSTITMAGQNYGNRNIPRVRKIFYCATILEFLGGLLFGSLFVLFGNRALTLFTNDPNVLSLSMRMLKIVSLSYFTYTFIESVSSVCKACGDAKAIMYIAIVTICFTRITYILFFPQPEAVYPIFAFPLSWIISSIAYAIYFFMNKKYRNK